MSIDNEIMLRPATPEECVSESMMLAFARKTADSLLAEEWKLEYNQPHLSINELTERANWKKCLQNSVEAIYFMNARHPEFFDKYIILTGKQGETDKFKHQPWLRHTFFVVLGKDGTYYSGSPANYSEANHPPVYLPNGKAVPREESEYMNPLDKVYKGSSIEELLHQIHADEGGEWPSLETVERALGDDYQEPQITLFNSRYIEDDGSEVDAVRVKANILEVTSDYNEEFLPPDNSPIHIQNAAATFFDLGSNVDPNSLKTIDAIQEEEFASIVEELSAKEVVDHSNDPKWI